MGRSENKFSFVFAAEIPKRSATAAITSGRLNRQAFRECWASTTIAFRIPSASKGGGLRAHIFWSIQRAISRLPGGEETLGGSWRNAKTSRYCLPSSLANSSIKDLNHK